MDYSGKPGEIMPVDCRASSCHTVKVCPRWMPLSCQMTEQDHRDDALLTAW